VFKPARIAASLLLTAATVMAEEPPLRDPMRPFTSGAVTGAAAAAAVPRFVLTAVLIAPTRRVAIVNGKPYGLGDAVDGAEIVAIELGSVRLREGAA
jgi:hypothetical protein